MMVFMYGVWFCKGCLFLHAIFLRRANVMQNCSMQIHVLANFWPEVIQVPPPNLAKTWKCDKPKTWKCDKIRNVCWFRFFRNHHARNVTRVSIVPRKVTVKIGDAENWWLGCRDKNRSEKAKLSIRLVLPRVPFKSGVWIYAYKVPKYVLYLLDCPVLEVKGKINVSLHSDVINRSNSID